MLEHLHIDLDVDNFLATVNHDQLLSPYSSEDSLSTTPDSYTPFDSSCSFRDLPTTIEDLLALPSPDQPLPFSLPSCDSSLPSDCAIPPSMLFLPPLSNTTSFATSPQSPESATLPTEPRLESEKSQSSFNLDDFGTLEPPGLKNLTASLPSHASNWQKGRGGKTLRQMDLEAIQADIELEERKCEEEEAKKARAATDRVARNLASFNSLPGIRELTDSSFYCFEFEKMTPNWNVYHLTLGRGDKLARAITDSRGQVIYSAKAASERDASRKELDARGRWKQVLSVTDQAIGLFLRSEVNWAEQTKEAQVAAVKFVEINVEAMRYCAGHNRAIAVLMSRLRKGCEGSQESLVFDGAMLRPLQHDLELESEGVVDAGRRGSLASGAGIEIVEKGGRKENAKAGMIEERPPQKKKKVRTDSTLGSSKRILRNLDSFNSLARVQAFQVADYHTPEIERATSNWSDPYFQLGSGHDLAQALRDSRGRVVYSADRSKPTRATSQVELSARRNWHNLTSVTDQAIGLFLVQGRTLANQDSEALETAVKFLEIKAETTRYCAGHNRALALLARRLGVKYKIPNLDFDEEKLDLSFEGTDKD